MQYINVGLVILSLVAGFGLAYLIPLRYGPHDGAFIGGMFAGSLVALLGGLMAGYVIAGLGEEWLGTAIGVPTGLFVGCFTWAVGLNYFSGGVAMGIVALMRRIKPGRT